VIFVQRLQLPSGHFTIMPLSATMHITLPFSWFWHRTAEFLKKERNPENGNKPDLRSSFCALERHIESISLPLQARSIDFT